MLKLDMTQNKMISSKTNDVFRIVDFFLTIINDRSFEGKAPPSYLPCSLAVDLLRLPIKNCPSQLYWRSQFKQMVFF